MADQTNDTPVAAVADPALWSSFTDLDTIGVLVVAAAFGALGGFVKHITAAPAPEAPVVKYAGAKAALVGLVAAVGALYALTPENGVKLVGMALVAGYAGKALLDALEARLRLATAERKVQTERADKHTALDVAEKALVAAGQPVKPAMVKRTPELGAVAPATDLPGLARTLENLRDKDTTRVD